MHLCDWPQAEALLVDDRVAFDMQAARRVVEMGRAARNAAAVKNRQPLAEVAVAAPPAERAALERLRDVVVDELNVKDLRLVETADELLAYRLKPNLKVLGPRLGKQVGELGAALAALDASEFVCALRDAGSAPLALAGGELRLAEDEVLVETTSPEGYRVEHDGTRTVALATVVDDDLRDEGLARELVHAVQLARKNAGLRIEESISLTLEVGGDLERVVSARAGYIGAETLATTLVMGTAAGDHLEIARLGGAEIRIGLSAVGAVSS